MKSKVESRSNINLITRWIVLFLCITSGKCYAQNTVTGFFPSLAGREVRLEGFDGFETYPIDSVQADNNGKFSLAYNEKDYGMGYLISTDEKSFTVLLSGEDVELKGSTLGYPETIEILKGRENKLFGQYAAEHPHREQALSAWDFLERIYNSDPLFTGSREGKRAIAREKRRIRTEDEKFLTGLGSPSYVSWYLPIRRLVSSVSIIAQYRTEEIPAAIATFRNLDYTDPRLYKSGLLGDVIESHFWLIENSGRSLDSVFTEMNISIDLMIANIAADEKKFSEIAGYLFRLLERRSLFGSSEYLALKVLNETSCTIDNNLAAQLESYRAMKIGNTAPDFAFSGDYFAPAYEQGKSPQKLSDLKNKYVLVVFGASWCPRCPEELYQVARMYEKWRKYGLEVVFISLDEDKQVFNSFSGIFPFVSMCDYQKWDSPIVKTWHVFATPSYFLLNDEQEILLRPNTAQHMDAWVEWYLIRVNR